MPTPAKPAKPKSRRATPSAPSRYDGSPVIGRDSESIPHSEGNLPMDCPVYMIVHRLEKPDGSPNGYTLEIDCFPWGRNVFVRLGREDLATRDAGSFKVFVKDQEGMKKLYEGSRGDQFDYYQSTHKPSRRKK